MVTKIKISIRAASLEDQDYFEKSKDIAKDFSRLP